MFVKGLPEEIFKKIKPIEFSSCIMQIISKFNVNHKLMIEALLTENEIKYTVEENNILAKFNEHSIITIEFDSNDRIINFSGNLSL